MLLHSPSLATILLTIYFLFFTQPSSSSKAAASGVSPDVPTYKEMMDFQEKRYEESLNQLKETSRKQQEISQQAMQSLINQEHWFLNIIQLGGSIWTAFWVVGGSVGFYFFKKLRDDVKTKQIKIDSLHAEIKKRREEIDVELAERSSETKKIENELNTWRAEIEGIHSELDEKRGKLITLVEDYKELTVKITLATFRSDLLSADANVRWRATQGVAAIAQGPGGVTALPILLECLQRPEEEDQVLEVALEALGCRGKEIMDDPTAIHLIAEKSSHSSASVKLAAVKQMGKIGPSHAKFQQCLKRCCESDPDSRVKEEACKIMRASHL